MTGWGRPSGPLDSPFVIVGRDFGYQENLAGSPFVGPAGKLLNVALGRAGLARSRALVTNVVNKRPPGDEWYAHQPGDIEAGTRQLHELLAAAPRKLIVTLGEQALQAVVRGDPRAKPGEDATITYTRGYGFDSPFGPVLAAVHPAFIMRNWTPWWATFCWDLQKASRLLTIGPDLERRRQRWLQWPEELAAFIVRARQAQRMAVDCETAPDGSVLCVAFAIESDEGVCVPVAPWSREGIGELLALPIPKVMHNGQFDCTVLERGGWRVVNFAFDTMLMWAVCEPMLAGKQEGKKGKRTEKSLRFLASFLTDEEFWKDYAFVVPEDRWLLCAKDARITLECCEKLELRLAGAANQGRVAA